MQDDAIHEDGIFDSSADLLHYPDIPQVHVGRGWGNEAGDGLDCDRGEDGGVLRDNLTSVWVDIGLT